MMSIARAARAQTAALIFSSFEYQAALVQQDYQSILGRQAELSGLLGWAQALRLGWRDEQILAGIAGSEEAFSGLQ